MHINPGPNGSCFWCCCWLGDRPWTRSAKATGSVGEGRHRHFYYCRQIEQIQDNLVCIHCALVSRACRTSAISFPAHFHWHRPVFNNVTFIYILFPFNIDSIFIHFPYISIYYFIYYFIIYF